LRHRFRVLAPGLATRPVIPVVVEDNDLLPYWCLIDTGALRNLMPLDLAHEAGVDLDEWPTETVSAGGRDYRAHHARCSLTVAGRTFEAPVSFCEGWLPSFGLLGQDGFLRYFRLEMSAAGEWFDLTWEADSAA
jgi:Aspartyl protease